MSSMRDRLRLARTEGVGPVTYARLLARFPDPAAALRALPEMARRGGRDGVPRIPTATEAEDEIAALARLGGRFVFADAADYPPALAALPAPPPALAVLGDVAALSARPVAVVGARNASLNGRRMAETLAEDLARAGLAVVSGLARGIDQAAHQGALRTGRTVAVVAGGLDVPYPPEHAALQAAIAAGPGAVVAEMRLGTEPADRLFPRRNRIVAGLSLGVVVIEAAPRSGSLITARLALEFGRELFAVPGSPLDPRCRGGNALIREGAHLVQEAADVLADLPTTVQPRPLSLAEEPSDAAFDQPLAADEAVSDLSDPAQIIDFIDASPIGVDEVVRRCHLPAAVVQAALLDLELAGRVELLPGNRAVRVAR
jgi:DNA processing protein